MAFILINEDNDDEASLEIALASLEECRILVSTD
jgi:hypothetical protein